MIVPFDITYEKSGKEFKDTLYVDGEVLHKSQKNLGGHDPEQGSHELAGGHESWKEESVAAIKKRILQNARSIFGSDLSGLSVDVRPNAHGLIDIKKLVEKRVALVAANDPGLLRNPRKLAITQKAVEQAVVWFKARNPEYFPGVAHSAASPPDADIKKELDCLVSGLKNTVALVNAAKLGIDKDLSNQAVTAAPQFGETVDPAKKLHPQTFIGNVLFADSDCVYQRAGNDVVKHLRNIFPGEPVVGKCYKISYRRGAGRVEGRGSEEEAAKLYNKRSRALKIQV